jgi:hypothetical protein
MTLTEQVAKNIIKKLLKGEDYRIEIVTLINAEFLQFSINFFKKVIEAKLNNQNVTADWYKEEFLNPLLPKEEIAINSGLNMKTISNMFNSSTRQVVIDASVEHYETLYNAIKDLIQTEHELELTLTVKLKSVSVDLNVSETLIVINTLAVKRAALRGGLWSTAGKRVEKPLMQTLCKLYKVPADYYKIRIIKLEREAIEETFEREIDFYLCSNDKDYKCEVKLMGKGNPESADAVIARASSIFIADKLSDTNKAQLDSLHIYWVELRNHEGFKKFKHILEALNIPHEDYIRNNIDEDLEKIFAEIFHS